MNAKNKLKAIAGVVMLLSSFTTFASTEPASTGLSEAKATDPLALEGKLQCYYNKHRTQVLFVNVVKADGDSVSVSDPSSDLKTKCAPHGQLTEASYNVEGDLTSRFLFWGGNLKVTSLQVSQK